MLHKLILAVFKFIASGVTLVKRPYTQESRQQDHVTLWSR